MKTIKVEAAIDIIKWAEEQKFIKGEIDLIIAKIEENAEK